ncbi:MAG: SUMF1/EgtB/PvdO family nonheme iron enzyme [Candidatus Wallbacteria bacterium]|nr:SUMF1/EgtB/PvdO family nonheme iron enzyme [Candidatus Wallbacteria bacterium]
MHLTITGTTLKGMRGESAVIDFNLSWCEAWKNSVNCDGVWVFAKYKDSDGAWKHADLAASSSGPFDYTDKTASGFSRGSEAKGTATGTWVPEHKKGMFVFRTQGEGDVSLQGVQMLWDTRECRITEKNLSELQVDVFGIEMVYIPQDKHFVGDPMGPNGPKNCLHRYPDQGAFLIESEDELRLAEEKDCLFCKTDNDRSRDTVPFSIPGAYPKGFAPFWYMKYGLSSRQYTDFLNLLTRKQQQGRVLSDISTDEIKNYHVMTNTADESLRQTIVCARRGNGTDQPVKFFTYAPERACNAIKWGDVAAFAAWAGLRPVTELEFEKACRGPLPAVPSECAWGSTEIGRVDTFEGCDGSGHEIKVPTTGIVNCCFGGGIAPFDAAAGKTEPENPGFEGPVSIGLFSKTRHEGVPKRINDGASYYGVMELSGNLWEPCVTLGHPAGRAFVPEHGNGALDENGDAQVAGWPKPDGAGAGVRGGVYRSPAQSFVAVALRFAAAHTKAERRFNGGLRVGF